MKKLIAGSKPSSVYEGPSEGELTVSNSAVTLQYKIATALSNTEYGALRLPEDQLIDGEWITQVDEYSARRREFLTELIVPYSHTYFALTSTGPVDVILVTGKQIQRPKNQVTLTDWLRLLVREEALDDSSLDYAKSALANVRKKPGEAWTTAAERVFLAFRATMIDSERPKCAEIHFSGATSQLNNWQCYTSE